MYEERSGDPEMFGQPIVRISLFYLVMNVQKAFAAAIL